MAISSESNLRVGQARGAPGAAGEVSTAAMTAAIAAAVTALKAGVAAPGDTLAELYALILLRATLDSPTFTNNPTAPTQSAGNNSTKLATTAFTQQEIANSFAARISTDTSLSANSDTLVPSQKAIKAYADALIAANDAMVFKGAQDCSANPNYPAGNRGDTYRVSVAGKIGGGSGVVVEAGDIFICNTDSTASGNQATVGTSWNVIQTNIDGAITGPASSTSGNIATFSGTSGKVVQDSGLAVDTDGALGANSDSKIATQKAGKTYADTKIPKAISGLTAAAAAADADLFATDQGAGALKQTLAAVKTWIKAWIVKADVGLGSVDNTSDATKNAASATLASKTLASPIVTGLLDLTGASGGQIAFPAAQNASAGANVLDDYEEGTFSAGAAFGGGATGVTYNNQTGRYVKVGQLVFVNADVNLSSKGSSTGAATLTGLPFTSGSAPSSQGTMALWVANMASQTGWIGMVDSSATTVSVWYISGGSHTQAQNTDFNNTSRILLGAGYRAAA